MVGFLRGSGGLILGWLCPGSPGNPGSNSRLSCVCARDLNLFNQNIVLAFSCFPPLYALSFQTDTSPSELFGSSGVFSPSWTEQSRIQIPKKIYSTHHHPGRWGTRRKPRGNVDSGDLVRVPHRQAGFTPTHRKMGIMFLLPMNIEVPSFVSRPNRRVFPVRCLPDPQPRGVTPPPPVPPPPDRCRPRPRLLAPSWCPHIPNLAQQSGWHRPQYLGCEESWYLLPVLCPHYS